MMVTERVPKHNHVTRDIRTHDCAECMRQHMLGEVRAARNDALEEAARRIDGDHATYCTEENPEDSCRACAADRIRALKREKP